MHSGYLDHLDIRSFPFLLENVTLEKANFHFLDRGADTTQASPSDLPESVLGVPRI